MPEPTPLPAQEAQSFYAPDRAAWRAWLAANHAEAACVWLILYRKDSSVPTLSYEAAVEEALCFGWIDSVGNKRNGQSSYLYMTRRKSASGWSALNKKRLIRLEAAGLIEEAGRAAIELAKSNGAWTALDDIDTVPPDLALALEQNRTAGHHFAAFPPSARRGILTWIVGAKTTETRTKRIAETVGKAAENLRANQWTPKNGEGKP